MNTFQNDEAGFLRWVAAHPDGFIANIDYDGRIRSYPMVHCASHKSLSTSKRGNYTTARYYKVCSHNLEELESWSRETFGKKLTHCKTCM